MPPFRALMGPKTPRRIPVAASVFGFLSIMKVPPPKAPHYCMWCSQDAKEEHGHMSD